MPRGARQLQTTPAEIRRGDFKLRHYRSPRVKMLKCILAKIRPEPKRDPVPPIKHYELPRAGRYRRR